MNYWLIKSEPDAYSWEQLVQDGETDWTGVRNYTARNNLQAMQVGDKLLYYHSNQGKNIVGIAEVTKAAFPDETDAKIKGTQWVAVTVKPVQSFKKPISLEDLKTQPFFKDMVLLNNSRLSVQPVTKAEFDKIIAMSNA